MIRKILIGGIAALVVVAGFWFLSRGLFPATAQTTQQTAERAADYYTCPMHPTVRSDHPGACPVCGMNLVRHSGEASRGALPPLGEVSLSPAQQVLANVATSVAAKRPLEMEIRAVGTISYAEPNLRQISMRFPGRIEKLHVNFEGQALKKGDPVADLYSPEAISAEQEYLLARGSGSAEMLRESRQKLLLWGFTEGQVDALDRSGTAMKTMTLSSPTGGTIVKKNVKEQQYVSAGETLFEIADLGVVWLSAELYEYESGLVKTGDPVEVSGDGLAGKRFKGKIDFVSPTIDPSSRTVRIRAEMPNRGGEFRPGMFVEATLHVRLPERLAVPVTSVLSTGNREVVWVQKSAGVFEPRPVRTGERTRDFVQILEGIHAGDVVVTSGGYLIDSESQMEAGPAHSHPGEHDSTNKH